MVKWVPVGIFFAGLLGYALRDVMINSDTATPWGMLLIGGFLVSLMFALAW